MTADCGCPFIRAAVKHAAHGDQISFAPTGNAPCGQLRGIGLVAPAACVSTLESNDTLASIQLDAAAALEPCPELLAAALDTRLHARVRA